MKVVVKDRMQLQKYLFFYRSFIFRFVSFETKSKDKEVKTIVEALNIKKRKKRIEFVFDQACRFIDQYYEKMDLCNFKDGKCACHRAKHRDIINGCCWKCRHQFNNGCTTRNVACKLFFCNYLKDDTKSFLEEKDILILKVLSIKDRYILRNDYYSSFDEVVNDIYYGFMIGVARMLFRYRFKRRRYKAS